IPREIEKAAYLEGASDFQVFWKVMLPLARPGILVGYTLNFIAIWKEFVFALVFLNSDANFPVTVGMRKLNSDRYMAVFNLPAAGLVISQIPIIILFILTYRQLSGGNFVGAVKGYRSTLSWPRCVRARRAKAKAGNHGRSSLCQRGKTLRPRESDLGAQSENRRRRIR